MDAKVVREITVSAIVIRKDGTIEDKGIIAQSKNAIQNNEIQKKEGD